MIVDPAKRPSLKEVLHSPGIVEHVEKILKSDEFHEQLRTTLKVRLEFGWGNEIEIEQFNQLKGEFDQSGEELISPWINLYLKRLSFNFRLAEYRIPKEADSFPEAKKLLVTEAVDQLVDD